MGGSTFTAVFMLLNAFCYLKTMYFHVLALLFLEFQPVALNIKNLWLFQFRYVATFVLLLFLFPFRISFAYMLYDIAHLLVADGNWRKGIYGHGSSSVDSLCGNLGSLILKVGAVSLVSVNPKLLVQRVYACFAVLAILCRQFPVYCLQGFAYHSARFCLEIFSQRIFSINIIGCGLYYINYSNFAVVKLPINY